MHHRTFLICVVSLAGIFGCSGQEPPANDAGPRHDAGPLCGNGQVDPGEECDHAERNSDEPNAVCRTNCLVARCGDSIVDDARGEQCDLALGNSDSPDDPCRTDCRFRRCGDGVPDPSFDEICDDGNTLPGDGCSADCLSDETCGNGIIDWDVGETCEDGNDDDQDGCLDCITTEIRVNTVTDGEACNPSVAMLDDGRTLVVWSRSWTHSEDWTYEAWIVGQLFAADGSRDGTEILIAGGMNMSFGRPDVGVLPARVREIVAAGEVTS